MLKLMTDAIALRNTLKYRIQTRVESFTQDQQGATAVEYALIVGLIAVAIIAAVTLLGGNISTLFNKAACSVKGGTWNATTNTCA